MCRKGVVLHGRFSHRVVTNYIPPCPTHGQNTEVIPTLKLRHVTLTRELVCCISWRQDSIVPKRFQQSLGYKSRPRRGAKERNMRAMFPFRRPVLTTLIAIVMYLTWIRLHVSTTISRNPSRFDIVLAYFDENPAKVRKEIELLKVVPAIAKLNPRVIIYTKGPTGSSDEAGIRLEVLRNQLGADIVRMLPNVGRESHTFLAHIVDQWDNLATHTLFGQALFHHFDRIPSRLETHFNATVGVMSLWEHSSCECEHCKPNYGGPKEGWTRVPQLFTLFNQEFCPPDGLLVTYKGQFIVSRDRIYRHSRKRFHWLLWISGNMSHFVHDTPPDIYFNHDNDLNNPYFGHSIGRAWLFMFGCNDLRIAKECESMDIKSESALCACYDR